MKDELAPGVTVHLCTKDNIMPIEIADKVIELKQIWTHEDVEETELSKEICGDMAQFQCKNCGHIFWVDFSE